jgi:hypothetical protein
VRLEDVGLGASAFDGIYAFSSGASNGAYFTAGDSWYPLSIYYDDLSTREFIDVRRALTSDIFNLNYAFETVLELVKPLDYAAVLNSGTPLHVAITDVDAVKTVTLSEFESKDDLKAALRDYRPSSGPPVTTPRISASPATMCAIWSGCGRAAIAGSSWISWPAKPSPTCWAANSTRARLPSTNSASICSTSSDRSCSWPWRSWNAAGSRTATCPRRAGLSRACLATERIRYTKVALPPAKP